VGRRESTALAQPPAALSPAARARARLRRGAYFLPSLFTIGNMLMGFYAIIKAVNGNYRQAALLIFGAGVLDSLDGRIARMTGTESEFGREYDSLADVVTFGVAPALIAWFWGLREFGRIGWVVPLFFLVCCATRLARFNVQSKVADSRYFVGLPAPAAAGAAASIFFFAPDASWKTWLGAGLLGSLLCLGLLMVSTFRYHSFKQIDLRRRQSYRALLPLAAVVLVAALRPDAFFLTVALLYSLSGPVGWLFGRLRRDGGRGGEGEPPATSPPAEVTS
jgi:CDP-diacylglycerol--serine O-phosphatidyltransferase